MSQSPRHYLIILLDGFSTLSFSAIVETLTRTAQVSGQAAVSYDLVSGSEELAAKSANGIEIACAHRLQDLLTKPLGAQNGIFVCCGKDVHVRDRKGLTAFLRLAHRQSRLIYGVDSATWVFAEAGILDGLRAAVHWRARSAFNERYPRVNASNNIFQVDRNITTCAGDLATVDMMLKVIERDFPDVRPSAVLNEMHHSYPRSENSVQPGDKLERTRNYSGPIKRVVGIMAENLEDPLPISDIANKVGVSARQIERIFAKNLNASPVKYYRTMRLESAIQLVEHTDMQLFEIAVATGFSTTSQLSRAFRTEFGATPSELRRANRR